MSSFFSVDERMRRRAFALTVLMLVLIHFGFELSLSLLRNVYEVRPSSEFNTTLPIFLTVASTAVMIIVSIRRLRDLEKPVWWVVKLLIPIVNLGLLFYLLKTPGTHLDNSADRVGLNPSQS